MKAIIVCVEYDDILELTLPYNRHHFDSVVVVTTPQDTATQAIATANNCIVHLSNDFYANGAHFNKWIPLEQGLDVLGRDGWLVIMDADVAWPKRATFNELDQSVMYSPRRYMNPHYSIPPESRWHSYPMHGVRHIWAGYTQIFHASAAGPIPWHESHYNCGGPDTIFQHRWKVKKRTPWNCLHLGPTETNWNGRIAPRKDGKRIDRTVDTVAMMEDHIRNFGGRGG